MRPTPLPAELEADLPPELQKEQQHRLNAAFPDLLDAGVPRLSVALKVLHFRASFRTVSDNDFDKNHL
jgi:hypothetical protein